MCDFAKVYREFRIILKIFITAITVLEEHLQIFQDVSVFI